MATPCGACNQRLQNVLTALSEGRLKWSGEIFNVEAKEGSMTFFIDRFGVIRQVFITSHDYAFKAQFPDLLTRAFKRLGARYIGGDYWIQQSSLEYWKQVFKDLVVEGEIKDYVRVSHGRL